MGDVYQALFKDILGRRPSLSPSQFSPADMTQAAKSVHRHRQPWEGQVLGNLGGYSLVLYHDNLFLNMKNK